MTALSSPKTINLHIETTPVKHTAKGPVYNARLHTPHGEIIVSSIEPLFAACRELVKRGITGHVRKFRDGELCAEGGIERFAKLTVCETDKIGPYLGKWRPPTPMTDGAKQRARKSSKPPYASSPTAVSPAEVLNMPPATKAAGGETRNPSRDAAIREVIDAGA
jgi:hypothetical protein